MSPARSSASICRASHPDGQDDRHEPFGELPRHDAGARPAGRVAHRVAGGLSGLNVTDEQLSDGLNAAKQIVENRINPFGVSESPVQRSGKDRLVVELPGVSAQTARDITRPAVLMFCEGLQHGGQGGGAGTPLGTVPDGRAIVYKPGTCQPDVDAAGQVLVKNADGSIDARVTPTFADQPRRATTSSGSRRRAT